MTSNKFVRHESCPRCLSRDNLGVWDDGHKWCFGCHYKEPPTRTLENSRKDEKNNNNADPSSNFSFCTSIPRNVLAWLKKYGISDAEIEQYHIQWEPNRENLILPLYEGDKIAFFQARYFGKEEYPRFKTFGKRRHFHVFENPPSESRVLIFVEDFISAIKVGRSYPAYWLCGSHVPVEAIIRAKARFSGVGVWLDPDKRTEASKAVLRASALMPSFGVYTDKDPKDYSTKEICEFVELFGKGVV